MEGSPSRYYDVEDREELIALLAVLADFIANAEADENYSTAACLHDWLAEAHSRLIELDALTAVRARAAAGPQSGSGESE